MTTSGYRCSNTTGQRETQDGSQFYNSVVITNRQENQRGDFNAGNVWVTLSEESSSPTDADRKTTTGSTSRHSKAAAALA